MLESRVDHLLKIPLRCPPVLHPGVKLRPPDQQLAADAIGGNRIAEVMQKGLEGAPGQGAVAGKRPEAQPGVQADGELHLAHHGNRLIAGWDTADLSCHALSLHAQVSAPVSRSRSPVVHAADASCTVP